MVSDAEHLSMYLLAMCMCSLKKMSIWVFCPFFNFFFLFCFLGPNSQHTEVPRLGSNRSYSCPPTPQLQQHQIWAMSVTYTKLIAVPDPYPLSKARDQTHLFRDTIQICFCCTTTGTPRLVFFFFFLICISWAVNIYILDIKCLSVIPFANIFSHSVGCLLVLVLVLFAVQKLSLIRYHLFIFAFVSFVLGDKFEKYCYNLCQRTFCIYLILGIL